MDRAALKQALCDCCTKTQFLELYDFARDMDCFVSLQVKHVQGGKFCLSNLQLVPHSQRARWTADRARDIRGKDWAVRMHSLRGPRKDGRPVKLPDERKD